MAGAKNGSTPVVQTHGASLPDQVREQMERSFGADFSSVRVHADSLATSANGVMGARAFTAGNDIHFAPGQFAPDNAAGRQLLAHELTHVVQQRSGSPLAATRVKSPQSAEAEAQLASYAAAAGEQAPVHVLPAPGSN
jgi:hypothetical protein